jgi:hypothetical protein
MGSRERHGVSRHCENRLLRCGAPGTVLSYLSLAARKPHGYFNQSEHYADLVRRSAGLAITGRTPTRGGRDRTGAPGAGNERPFGGVVPHCWRSAPSRSAPRRRCPGMSLPRWRSPPASCSRSRIRERTNRAIRNEWPNREVASISLRLPQAHGGVAEPGAAAKLRGCGRRRCAPLAHGAAKLLTALPII